jgi:hypothetical protein
MIALSGWPRDLWRGARKLPAARFLYTAFVDKGLGLAVDANPPSVETRWDARGNPDGSATQGGERSEWNTPPKRGGWMMPGPR